MVCLLASRENLQRLILLFGLHKVFVLFDELLVVLVGITGRERKLELC